ncbi:hypothetical protein [Heyndrickxia coagulans]|uniref:hypothetical protein n=1 Tax=Heyndrickxia coagulans TaxID=1398 RepID=UPI002E236BD0|nr:hypothetical protein [Heyndrickxia coagulans]
MPDDKAKKILSLLEKGEADSETTDSISKLVSASSLLTEILILVIENGWNVSELKRAAKLILTLPDC